MNNHFWLSKILELEIGKIWHSKYWFVSWNPNSYQIVKNGLNSSKLVVTCQTINVKTCIFVTIQNTAYANNYFWGVTNNIVSRHSTTTWTNPPRWTFYISTAYPLPSDPRWLLTDLLILSTYSSGPNKHVHTPISRKKIWANMRFFT